MQSLQRLLKSQVNTIDCVKVKALEAGRISAMDLMERYPVVRGHKLISCGSVCSHGPQDYEEGSIEWQILELLEDFCSAGVP